MSFKNLSKRLAAFLAIMLCTECIAFDAECAPEESTYSYNAEERLYLAGVAEALEGKSYAMHDIDEDDVSELFILDEEKARLDVFRCSSSDDEPQLAGSVESVSEVCVRESGPGMAVKVSSDGTQEQKEYIIENGKLTEKPESDGEWTTIHWVDPGQWVDGSIVGVADLVGDPGQQNDYYLSSNYEWLSEEHVSAPGEISSGTDSLEQNVKANKEQMLEDRETWQGDDIQRVRDYYDAATNWEKRNADGIEPVRRYLDAVESVSTMEELADYLADPETDPFCLMLSIKITLDEKDTSHWAVELAEDNFSVLPRIYHNESREDVEDVRKDFDNKARHVLSRAGYEEDEIERILKECYEMEEQLLPLAWPGEDDDKDVLAGFVPYEDVMSVCGHFPLERLLNAYGIEEGKIHVWYPAYLRKLDSLWTEENLNMLKSYALAHTAEASCDYLDLDAYRCLQGEGTPEDTMDSLNDMYKTEVLSARGPMGVAEENAYMTFFADPETRKDLTALAEDIRGAFREILSNEPWLSEEGKTAAIEKLDNMTFSVMSPDVLIDSSYLSIDPEASFLDNCVRIQVNTMRHNGAFAGKIREKGDWRYDLRPEIATTDVNSFYYGCFNQFFILDGFVQDSVYRQDMPIEEKLGLLGEIIGHELTHGFDPSGIEYDKNGCKVVSDDNPYGWMPKEDYEAFQERASKVAEALNSICALPYDSCPGEKQWGEAAADIGGMTIGLAIAAKTDGFDYDRYFRSHSTLWRKQSTLIGEKDDLYDEHPLSHLRINLTVQQFDEFMETYDVHEGDGMYLWEEDRIRIW